MMLIIFTKIVNKVDIDITERDMRAVHCIGKEGRTNIKFSNRKDCQALLKVKRDLNYLNMKDFDFEENKKIYINENLCPYYRVPWTKSKRLHQLQKIFSFYASNRSNDIQIKKNDKEVIITHTAVFEKYFLRIDLSPPYQS